MSLRMTKLCINQRLGLALLMRPILYISFLIFETESRRDTLVLMLKISVLILCLLLNCSIWFDTMSVTQFILHYQENSEIKMYFLSLKNVLSEQTVWLLLKSLVKRHFIGVYTFC